MIRDLLSAGYSFSDLIAAFPGSSSKQVEQRYTDSALGLHRTIERFGYLGTRPCTSEHFNVNEHGERIVPSHGNGGSRLVGERAVTRVAIYGGSFVMGAGLSDGETIPAQVQRLLVKLRPSRRYVVVNAGAMNHTSQHASQRFADRALSGNTDDVAIFLDGWNDCYHAGKSGDGILPFLNAVLEGVQTSDANDVTLRDLKDSYESARSVALRGVKPSEGMARGEFTFLRRRLELALSIRSAVSLVSSTRILNYWEPSIYSDFEANQDLVPRVRQFNARESLVRLHMEAEHHGRLTDIFEDYGVKSLSDMGKRKLSGVLFIDGVHPSPLLAESIAERLASDLIGNPMKGHRPVRRGRHRAPTQGESRGPGTNNPDMDIYPLW